MQGFSLAIVILLIAGGISIGSVLAFTYTDENLIVYQPSSGGSITTQAGNFAAIKLQELDSGQIYQFRLTGDGARFDIVDITHNRVGLSMLSSNGNIGIGTGSGTEKLDVNGNLRVRGDILLDNGAITSANDICIGSCP